MLPSRIRKVAWRVGHRGRATATFTIAAGLVSAMLGMLAYSTSRGYLTSQRERAIRDRTYLDARSVRDALRSEAANPGAALAALALEEGTTALVRLDDEWYTSSVAVEADDLPLDVLAELEAGAVAWQRYELRGETSLAIAVPMPAVDAVYAAVVPMRELDDTLATMAQSLLLAAIATTLTGGVIGFLAAGRLVRPLRKLAARAEAIAAGDALQLDEFDDPDLAPLAHSVNRVIEAHSRRAQRDSRFVSDVSHEVRAPLAALAAAIAVMERRRGQLPERSAHALDLLAEQVEDFQQLVLDLLDLSRIDAGRAEPNLEPTDCERLVRHAVAQTGSEVPVLVDGDVPSPVLLDRRRVGQALANLLENARLYAGGATRMSVTRRGDTLVFGVEDRGPGVPIDERSRIFGRFERGEHGQRGPKGSGLGLALVAEHAALLGGRVRIEDNADGGVTFLVEVRLCEPR